MSGQPPGAGGVLRHVAAAGGWLTWLVTAAVFVGLLGGTHPSDALRDRVIAWAAALVAALNLPAVLWLAGQVRRRQPMRAIAVPALSFCARVAVATWALWVAGGISHERGP